MVEPGDAAELTIRKKLPKIHESLLEAELSEQDWQTISDDLESLNWLDQENTDLVIGAIYDIVDHNALETLAGQTRFNIFEVNRIKLDVYSILHKIVAYGGKNTTMAYECKRKASNLKFFSTIIKELKDLEDEELYECFNRIHEIYKTLRGNILAMLLILDKTVQKEIMGLKDMLDENFNTKVIGPIKFSLKENDEIASDILEYGRRYAVSTVTVTYWGSSNTYIPKDNVFIGETDEQGLRQGWGRQTFQSDDLYEGYWGNNKPHGFGVYTWKNGAKYEGTFENGTMHGQGTKTYYNGNKYTGQWKEGKKNGEGTMMYANHDTYEGMWKNDSMEGKGRYTWYTGDSFTGSFVQDRRIGKGVLRLESGEEIQGEWATDGSMKETSENEP